MVGGLVILLCAACLLRLAWWMRTHEFWATRNDRRSYEQAPTTLHSLNYRLSQMINRWLVPAGLGALGVVGVIVGANDVWSSIR